MDALNRDLSGPVSDDQIVDRIVAAVMERRLKPGAKLPENTLCDAFGVSRSQIRRVFIVLAQRGIVALHPNRGAFVASPTPEEARYVFEARRTLERSIIAETARRITAEQIGEMRNYVAGSAAAAAMDNRGEAVRLSGEFHIQLARVAGNPVTARFVEELVARTSLIIAMFGSRQSFSCSEGEHNELLEALEDHDGARATALMDHHLEHIERELDIQDADAETTDLREILSL
ncbi:MAG TPA: GntR family transcriptional regulator [Roseiarcus sp.]|nr:GntR family transcriptional regulator [Roseiarcus sp.]